MVYFVLALFENLLERVYSKTLQIKIWKLSHFVFTDMLTIEMLITIIFWGVLVPFGGSKSGFLATPFDIGANFVAHLLPLILLYIDMGNNLVCFWNWKHFGVTAGILILYLVMNAVYTLTVGNIYVPLKYTDWMSYIFVIGCVAIGALCYLVNVGITKCKKKRVFKMLGLDENGEPMKNSNESAHAVMVEGSGYNSSV